MIGILEKNDRKMIGSLGKNRQKNDRQFRKKKIEK